MPATYETVAQTTLTSNTTTVTFSSLPSTYTDLEIVIDGYYNGTTYGVWEINGDTNSANYTYQRVIGYSSAPVLWVNDFTTSSDGLSLGNSDNAMMRISFFNYAATNCFKHFDELDGINSTAVGMLHNVWKSTSAINSIAFIAKSSQTFASGTKFSIYGIKRA